MAGIDKPSSFSYFAPMNHLNVFCLLGFVLVFQDKTVDPWKEKFKDDDGIELMIPAYVDDFPAQVILAFVESADIDITEEYVPKCSSFFCYLTVKYKLLTFCSVQASCMSGSLFLPLLPRYLSVLRSSFFLNLQSS